MYGLPDSAVLGTAKRLRGRRHRSASGWEDLHMIIHAVRDFRARRRVQKEREMFFKKHGYYKQ